MEARDLSIGEVAERTGLRPSALRYYERIGLLPRGERVSGRRRYDRSVYDLLAVIDLSRRAGFTLAETGTLLSGFSPDTPPSERWRTMALRKLPEVEALIARAEEMKRILERGLDCHCLRIEDCELLDLS